MNPRSFQNAFLFFAVVSVFLTSSLSEELPGIGIIDSYGLETVQKKDILERVKLTRGDPIPIDFGTNQFTNADEVRKMLDLPAGSPVPANVREIEERIQQVKGVTKAKIATVCCEPDGTATLFVGIQEKNKLAFNYRKQPKEEVALTQSMIATYDRYLKLLIEAVRSGTAQEDDSQGHALFNVESLQPIQNAFISFANQNQTVLKKVLLDSENAKHRAAAASIIGYSSDKKFAVEPLLEAVRDPDEGVRNNAARAIGCINVLANKRPELGIRIDPEIFIEMLRSLSWSDRNKATMVLLSLTEKNRPDVLEKLRVRVLPELIEMARWEDSHSLMALNLLGRIAQMTDSEITEVWKGGKRESVIERALNR